MGCRQSDFANRRGWVLNAMVAALLIAAASLKARSAIPAADGWALAQVLFEFAAAIWLLSGWRAAQAWLLVVCMFAVFTALTGYKAVQRARFCGCFGKVEVDPRLTLVMDAGVLGSLLCWRRPLRRVSPRRGLFFRMGLAGTAVAVALVAAPALQHRLYARPVSTSRTASLLGDANGDFIILDPESWLGQPLPLTGYVRPSVSHWPSGTCVVLLYHDECPECQAVLDWLEQSRRRLAHAAHLVVLRFPPFSGASSDLLRQASNASVYRLRDDRDWFAPTPTLLVVQDGLVRRVIDAPSLRNHRSDSRDLGLLTAVSGR